MAPDVLVSRELKSLQDELSAAKTQRAANKERSVVCTENLIRVDDVMESRKLAE